MHAARGFWGFVGIGPRAPRDDLEPRMNPMNADASTKLDLPENDGGVKWRVHATCAFLETTNGTNHTNGRGRTVRQIRVIGVIRGGKTVSVAADGRTGFVGGF